MKIKLVHPDAICPKYAHNSDAGMDLYSVEDVCVVPGQWAMVATGIKIELPEDMEAQIRPKSGLANQGLTVLNTPGTVDSGYRGEVKVLLVNFGTIPFKIEKGMKIAQMVINKVEHPTIEIVMELTESDRGEGGFGSTGLK